MPKKHQKFRIKKNQIQMSQSNKKFGIPKKLRM